MRLLVGVTDHCRALQSPDRMQLFRSPELEQGQAGFTQTATILLRGVCAHGLPGGNQEAPARSRRSRAVKRQRAIRTLFFHGMNVTRFNERAKDEEAERWIEGGDLSKHHGKTGPEGDDHDEDRQGINK